ncbi:MAG: hypothetical protein Q8L37_02390 [Candidatus Gottesmanbacteria bacterium]|nr:hypothetical protein [Candidatus Gottesmanbacteria bacterium]
MAIQKIEIGEDGKEILHGILVPGERQYLAYGEAKCIIEANENDEVLVVTFQYVPDDKVRLDLNRVSQETLESILHTESLKSVTVFPDNGVPSVTLSNVNGHGSISVVSVE